jgi:hypothetical protein
VNEPLPGFTGLRTAGHSALQAAAPTASGTELFVRHARREGASVAILRAIDYGNACVVEAEVHPVGSSGETVRPGPYRFADARQATAFVTDAVESLMYLGCDIYAE